MHNIMVWKIRVRFSLFCLLQRCAAWVAAFCNPIYCSQKRWLEPGRVGRKALPTLLDYAAMIGKMSEIRFRFCRPAILMVLLLWFSSAALAVAPTFQAAGTMSAGTGTRTVAWPTHAVNDIALLIVQTANQSVTLSTPAGFVEIPGSPQGTGTAGGSVATRLTVYWARATSSGMTSPVVADSGNNQVARIITFRGAIETGNPWDVTVGDVRSSAGASFAIPGAATTVSNALVVAIVANGTGSSNAQTSGWANAGLSGLAEVADGNATSGNGGGFGVATGEMINAGTYGSTAGILAQSSVQGRMSIALKPSSSVSGAACIPTTVSGVASPLIAGVGKLSLGNGQGNKGQTSNGTVNGTTIVVTGSTSLPVTATTSSLSAGALPALSPATFPAVGTGTLSTTGTVAAGSYGAINATGNPTVFSGGTYYIDTLNAASGSIQLAAGTYFINKLNLSVNLTVTGAVQLFIGNKVDLGANGVSLNSGGNAGNLQVNLYGGAEFDAEKNNVSFTGLIYGPGTGTQVKFDNNATITGAIITGGEIKFGNNPTFNYDATVQAQIASLTCSVSGGGADHIEIDHTGSALTCQSPVLTVKACANAACSSLYTGGASVTLLPGGAVVNTGTTGSVTGAVAQASAGVATLGATVTPATPNATICLNTTTNTTSCAMTFEDAGFVINVPNRDAGVNTADVTIDALKKGAASATCVAAFPASTQPVKLHTTYGNPTTGTQAATVSTGAVSTGAPGTVHNLTFNAAGRVTTALSYPDVGLLTLNATGTGLNGVAMTSTGGTFVVKPFGFVLSGIKQTAAPQLANPAAADAAGAKFVKAGEAFTATVAAVDSNGNATPNYGQETPAENVKLTSALVAPAGGNNPAVSGSFGTFANGGATGTDFTWNEVGIIMLTPSILSGNYLGVAGNTTGTVTGNVGRFYAAQFALSAASLVNRADIAGCVAPCDGFTYMGEKMNAVFTLTAQAVGGATTKNYNYSSTSGNNFAMLDPTAVGNPLKFGAVDNGTVRTLLSSRVDTSLSATGSFSLGVANVSAPLLISRLVNPVNLADPLNVANGPYASLDIGIAPLDSDGAVMAAYDLDATNAVSTTNDHTKVARTEVRYGYMALSNAFGSELLPLPITATAQYWNGSAYVTNILDNNTRFTVSADPDLTLSNRQNLVANPTVQGTAPVSVDMVSGVGAFTFNNTNASGSVDFGISTASALNNYLPSTPARATFGIYKGNNKFIYTRELY